MNFYTHQHKHYCGIDLHARAMYVCILDQSGAKLVHKNLLTTLEAFLRIVAPYRDELVVGVECIFTWYWLADLCQKEGVAFVLGHALSRKATIVFGSFFAYWERQALNMGKHLSRSGPATEIEAEQLIDAFSQGPPTDVSGHPTAFFPAHES